MGSKISEAREFFTWKREISNTINYSCAACKYNISGKCDRRPEMVGKALPIETEKKPCLFGSVK